MKNENVDTGINQNLNQNQTSPSPQTATAAPIAPDQSASSDTQQRRIGSAVVPFPPPPLPGTTAEPSHHPIGAPSQTADAATPGAVPPGCPDYDQEEEQE